MTAGAKEFKFGAGASEFVPSFSAPPVEGLVAATADLAIASAVAEPAPKPVIPVPSVADSAPLSVGGSASSAATPVEGEDFADTFDEFGGAPTSAKAVPAEGDPREHLNTVFIGHVDAGKSTLSGSILFHTGQVDARAIEKFEREAKAKNR